MPQGRSHDGSDGGLRMKRSDILKAVAAAPLLLIGSTRPDDAEVDDGAMVEIRANGPTLVRLPKSIAAAPGHYIIYAPGPHKMP